MIESQAPGMKLVDALRTVVARRAADRAVAITEIAERLIFACGPLRRADSELRAGDVILNEDRDLLAMLSRASSLGISLYLGNRRIATASVVDSGRTPAIGGYANATLVDAVLRKREVFRGSLEQEGRKCIVACRPLYAARRPEDDQSPLGMIEAFFDEESFLEILSSAVHQSRVPTTALDEQGLERIAAVTVFVDDMARRLQLLALNGNIIASQAGEHGSAFRVVCRELGTLAERSKGAVGDFHRLVHELGLGSATDLNKLTEG